MEVSRNNLYDHIETSHRNLAGKIDDVSRRTTQQVFSIDKLTKERLDTEKREREDVMKHRFDKDQATLERHCRQRHHNMKHELEVYVDRRMMKDGHGPSNRGWPGEDRDDGYNALNLPQYHQDDMLNKSYLDYVPGDAPLPGRLYKCKSDESLSVHSSRASKKHWKIRARARQEMNDMNMYGDRTCRRDQREKSRSQSREPPAGQITSQPHSEYGRQQPAAPSSEWQENCRAHSGRTPEGQEQGGYRDFSDRYQQRSGHQHSSVPVAPQTYGSTRGLSQLPGQKGNTHCVQVDVHHSQPQTAGVPVVVHRNNDRPVQAASKPSRYSAHFEPTLTSLAEPRTSGLNPPQTGKPNASWEGNPRISASTSIPNLDTPPRPGSVQNPRGIPHSLSYDSANPDRALPVSPAAPPNTPGNNQWNSTGSSSLTPASQVSSPLYPSPDFPQQTHIRTDSGSNPDSGYGSRLYRLPNGRVVAGSSSSYPSSHDPNSSVATTVSSLTEVSPAGYRHNNTTNVSLLNQSDPTDSRLPNNMAPPHQKGAPGMAGRWYPHSNTQGKPSQDSQDAWPAQRPAVRATELSRSSSEQQSYYQQPRPVSGAGMNQSRPSILGKATQV